MVEYEKLNDKNDMQHSQSLLNDTRGEDEQSSSDESIVDRPIWVDSFHRNRRFIDLKTVISLLLLLVIIFSAIVLLLAWMVINLRTYHNSAGNGKDVQTDAAQSHNTRSNTGISTCGTTSAEAIAASCHFDIFSFGWTPQECTDWQLYNESLDILESQVGDSSAFFLRASTSSEHTSSKYDSLPLSSIQDYALGITSAHGAMADDQEVLATWEHYLVACTYSWQKVQRAAMKNWPLEEWSSSYALASRCGPDLLTREKRESDSIMWHLKAWYPRCGLEAEDLQREVAAALQ
jgi:hypothetical protein